MTRTATVLLGLAAFCLTATISSPAMAHVGARPDCGTIRTHLKDCGTIRTHLTSPDCGTIRTH